MAKKYVTNPPIKLPKPLPNPAEKQKKGKKVEKKGK